MYRENLWSNYTLLSLDSSRPLRYRMSSHQICCGDSIYLICIMIECRIYEISWFAKLIAPKIYVLGFLQLDIYLYSL